MIFIDDSLSPGIIETLLPYLGSGVLGSLLLGMYHKWANKKRDVSEINRIDAETEQIQTLTIKNLTQELSTITDKLIGQVDINSLIKEELSNNNDSSIFKLRNKDEELILSAKKALQILAKLEQLEFISEESIKSIRRLMDKIGLAYWEADSQGQAIFVSSSWLKLFSLTEATMADWINNVVVEDREILMSEWMARVTDQDASGFLSFKIYNKNREPTPVKALYSIIRTKSGNIDKIIGVTLVM